MENTIIEPHPIQTTFPELKLKDLGILRLNLDESELLIKEYCKAKTKFLTHPIFGNYIDDDFVDVVDVVENSGEISRVKFIPQFHQLSIDDYHAIYDNRPKLNSDFIYLFEDKFNPKTVSAKIIGLILSELCTGDLRSKVFTFEDIFKYTLNKSDDYFSRRSLDVHLTNKVKPWLKDFFGNKLLLERVRGVGFKLVSNE